MSFGIDNPLDTALFSAEMAASMETDQITYARLFESWRIAIRCMQYKKKCLQRSESFLVTNQEVWFNRPFKATQHLQRVNGPVPDKYVAQAQQMLDARFKLFGLSVIRLDVHWAAMDGDASGEPRLMAKFNVV